MSWKDVPDDPWAMLSLQEERLAYRAWCDAWWEAHPEEKARQPPVREKQSRRSVAVTARRWRKDKRQIEHAAWIEMRRRQKAELRKLAR